MGRLKVFYIICLYFFILLLIHLPSLLLYVLGDLSNTLGQPFFGTYYFDDDIFNFHEFFHVLRKQPFVCLRMQSLSYLRFSFLT